MAAMYQAIEALAHQVAEMASVRTGCHGKTGTRDSVERFRNVKVFPGGQEDYDEFATKLRSEIASGNHRVTQMVKVVEHDCAEERLIKNKLDECSPEC